MLRDLQDRVRRMLVVLLAVTATLLFCPDSPAQTTRADDVAQLQTRASTGEVPAMLRLGWVYDSGRGVSRDYEKAMTWYRKAADAGNLEAMRNIGLLYAHGRGVPQ